MFLYVSIYDNIVIDVINMISLPWLMGSLNLCTLLKFTKFTKYDNFISFNVVDGFIDPFSESICDVKIYELVKFTVKIASIHCWFSLDYPLLDFIGLSIVRF